MIRLVIGKGPVNIKKESTLILKESKWVGKETKPVLLVKSLQKIKSPFDDL